VWWLAGFGRWNFHGLGWARCKNIESGWVSKSNPCSTLSATDNTPPEVSHEMVGVVSISWWSHLFSGRPGIRRYERPEGQLSDVLTWRRRALSAGVSSLSRATCPNREVCWQDRTWRQWNLVDLFVQDFVVIRTRSYQRIPSSRLKHFWWKASRDLISAANRVHLPRIMCLVYTELGS